MKGRPNFRNRTVWTGDNLDILRGINSESVELIYLDPPFNSNRNYSAPIGSKAAGAAFKDAWTLDDVDEAWHGEIADRDPALYAIINAAGLAHGKSMKSYLIMMAVRLLELRRVRTHRHTLYGRQEGICNGCLVHFPYRNLTVDHIVPQSKGGSHHEANLQLLCGACNSKKGERTMEALIADLLAAGIRNGDTYRSIRR